MEPRGERALKRMTLPKWADGPTVSEVRKVDWKTRPYVTVLSVHIADNKAWFSRTKDDRNEEVRKLQLEWRRALEAEGTGIVPDWSAFLELRTDSGAIVGGSKLIGVWAD